MGANILTFIEEPTGKIAILCSGVFFLIIVYFQTKGQKNEKHQTLDQCIKAFGAEEYLRILYLFYFSSKGKKRRCFQNIDICDELFKDIPDKHYKSLNFENYHSMISDRLVRRFGMFDTRVPRNINESWNWFNQNLLSCVVRLNDKVIVANNLDNTPNQAFLFLQNNIGLIQHHERFGHAFRRKDGNWVNKKKIGGFKQHEKHAIPALYHSLNNPPTNDNRFTNLRYKLEVILRIFFDLRYGGNGNMYHKKKRDGHSRQIADKLFKLMENDPIVIQQQAQQQQAQQQQAQQQQAQQQQAQQQAQQDAQEENLDGLHILGL